MTSNTDFALEILKKLRRDRGLSIVSIVLITALCTVVSTLLKTNPSIYVASTLIGILLGSLCLIADRLPCSISNKVETVVVILHFVYIFTTFTIPIAFLLYFEYCIDSLLNLVAYWCGYGIMVLIAYGIILRLELERDLKRILYKSENMIYKAYIYR